MLVAATASLAAYAHPAEFEMKPTRRAIIVPSETFREWVRIRQTLPDSFLLGADVPSSFVETRYFVAVTLKIRDYVLVAYRGTADGYDLFLDMRFKKSKIPAQNGIDARVHRGFAKAFLEGFPYVHEHLASLKPYKFLIGSGHSLGGAICTLHNAASNSYSNDLTNPLSLFSGRSRLHPMRSCVTFGSPKVGNMAFASYCPWGTNVFRSNDPVPMLPISLLEYERQPIGRLLPDPSEPKLATHKWLLPIQRKRRLIAFADHSMEGYVRLCGEQVGVNVSQPSAAKAGSPL
jgi:hypothetical protein